ncbi:MAG: penicillin acylase family protein [Acidobacteriaceae bacterium]|nr:penicillin acylase family protein [Acidobacteriaceae bacterium]
MNSFEQPGEPEQRNETPAHEPTEATSEPRLLTRRSHDEDEAAEASPNLREQAEARASSLRMQAAEAVARYRQRRRQIQQESPEAIAARATRASKLRWRKWIFLSAALVLFLLLSLGGFIVSLRHDLHDSLPQLDGEAHTAGLSEAVTVARNDQGVPAITAKSIDDLLFAQGYVTAQDRLWQMDVTRRHAAGELAEILGSGLVDHDRQQRILQLRATADRAVASMPEDQRKQLEAYARGVNAFLNSHSNALPVEFSLLHYTPEPWQPRDSLLVLLAMWQDLSTSFPVKLNREALSTHLPANLLADLYPTSTYRDRIPSEPRHDLTTPVEQIEQIPLDSTQSSLIAPADLLRRQQSLTREACTDCRAGSNNWAVAASRSASGAPLLSNDMHLGLQIPNTWYEAVLHAPNLDVAGFSLPGVPFIMVGRNAHVAWSFTNLGGDVQDLYIEHTRGSGSSLEYQQRSGAWAPVQHHTEIIKVRARRNVTVEVQTTEHPFGASTISTPILSSLYPGEKRSLALEWAAYAPNALSNPLLAIEQATSGQSLVEAFRGFGGPTLNLVWADDAHHIGYHAVGIIPVRGSMERRPRNLPTLDLGEPTPEQQTTPVPADEPDADSGDGAQTMLREFTPHLTLAAWEPTQRHRHTAHRVEPKPAPKAASRRKTTSRRASRHSTHELREQLHAPRPVAEKKLPPAEPIAPPKAKLDYTIGAPVPDVPVAASDASAVWVGQIPYDELPSVVDPPNGVIATANARITPDDYPYFIANNWANAYRVERIYRRLDGRVSLTAADMTQLQHDTYSDYDRFVAHRIAYAIDHAHYAKGDADRLQNAADLLRHFGGDMTPESSAAAIVDAIRKQLRPALLTPQIRVHDGMKASDKKALDVAMLYNWMSSDAAIESILLLQPARWLPQGFNNWNDFLAATALDALKEAKAPRDLSRWRYADVHRQNIAHPLFGEHPGYFRRVLGVVVGLGPQSVGGDNTTVNATAKKFGASERFTTDLSSPDATVATLPSGQSGNLASPNALDQAHAYLDGSSFALPLMTVHAKHTLTLLPQ